MTKEEFTEQMTEVLQTEESLSMDTILSDLDEWDSLSMMATMTFLDRNFGVKVKIVDLKALNTLGDIAALAKI